MERITIVGTGAIGTSLGLALKSSGVRAEVVGFDIRRGVAERAKKRGGLDIAFNSLEEAIEGTRLVVLATPTPVMRELLQFIGPNLEEGAVVTDTGGTKVAVLQWAEQHLPSAVSFVGGHPLATSERTGPEAASEALFQGTLYALCPAKNSHPDAVKTVANAVEAVGATPYFMDPAEHDSYAAAITYLPFMLSLGLVTSTTSSPAWREMHKMASTVYRDASRLTSGDPATNLGMCETNRDNVIYWVDEAIKRLYETRNLLKAGDNAKLEELFTAARDARARWMAGVSPEPKSSGAVPPAGEVVSSLFFGSLASKALRGRSDKDRGEKEGRKQRP